MLPRVPIRLTCGCRRKITINTDPTKARGPLGDAQYQLRKFLSKHKENAPSNFVELTSDVDLDWLPTIRPNHFNDRLDDLRKNTSPGIYYVAKGYRTKTDVIDNCANELRYYCHMIKTGKLRNPRPLTRLVSVDTKVDLKTGIPKTRVAWCFPLQVIAIENMWFSAIKDNIPADYVPTPSTAHSMWCGQSSRSFDFSSFDASVPRWLVEQALDILESHFDHSLYASGDKPYSRTSLNRLWNFVRWYILNTPVFVNDRVYTKVHGVPSGSMFTNILDSIISKLIMMYVHRSEGCHSECTTYGDDCHVRNCTCEVATIENAVSRHFGMTIKVEKPNEHGCLTYCKAECHNGQPFHSGLWFSNILNCVSSRLKDGVAHCLKYMTPTRFQYKELCKICPDGKSTRIHPRTEHYLAKMLTSGRPEEYDLLKQRGPVTSTL